MARVLALTVDLLFGSRLQAGAAAGGHELELVADAERLRARLAADAGTLRERQAADGPDVKLLIADLTDERLDGAATVRALKDDGMLSGVATLAFYSHVDADARARAEQAGFDLIVPRSRMAREGAALIARLAQRRA